MFRPDPYKPTAGQLAGALIFFFTLAMLFEALLLLWGPLPPVQ